MAVAACGCRGFTRGLSCFSSFTRQSRLLENNHMKQAVSLQWTQTRNAPRPTFALPEINSEEEARSAALRMSEKGRLLMLHELQRIESNPEGNNLTELKVPGSLLWEVIVFNGIPFIGFGMLDNIIMILAGEYIDVTLGAALGISTMAAAALGNLVSDVAGVGSAGYVELLVEKLGVRPPLLSPRQLAAQATRWAIALGRALGITVGCLIGMFPLLFFARKREDDDQEDAPETTSTDTQTTPSAGTQTPSAATSQTASSTPSSVIIFTTQQDKNVKS